MERIPSSPPVIAPVPLDKTRPLWSVMIPVYNCAEYIPEVLAGILAQDRGPEYMQIEVIDDASTDADIAEMVALLGKGRVGYYRQPENMGSLRNFETCINRSRGHLVHLIHGDDRVKPGFYQKMAGLFDEFPAAGAAFCRYSFIQENGEWSHNHPVQAPADGILKNWLARIAGLQRIQYVAMVVRREVYEKLGGYYGMPYGEDWEMWVRIARFYPVAYTPEILAEYRMRSTSISGQLANSGQSFTYLLKAFELIQAQIMQEDLPEKVKKEIIKKGKQHCALYSLALAKVTWQKTHNLSLAQERVNTALRLRKSPKVLYYTLRYYVKLVLNL